MKPEKAASIDAESQDPLQPSSNDVTRRQNPNSYEETPRQRCVGTCVFAAAMLLLLTYAWQCITIGDAWQPLGKQEPRLQRDGKAYAEFLSDAGRLLPASIHKTILDTPEQLATKKRIVVVGDVHGCLHEMRELLQKVNFSQETDQLLFNGDMVNKGPYPVEVLQEIQKLGGLSVRGNNDDAALASWEAWHRGVTELPKKTAWVTKLPKADAQWLQQLPWTIRIPPLNLVMVHGGLIPEIPLRRQDLQSLFTVRELIQNHDGCWRMAQDKEGEHGPEWTSVYTGRDYVIFGHDAARGLQQGPRSLGLDTGCVYGNVLTSAEIDLANSTGPAGNGDIIDNLKLYSVKAHHKYAPYNAVDPEDD